MRYISLSVTMLWSLPVCRNIDLVGYFQINKLFFPSADAL